jgi:signal transduction histidine kinase
VVIEDRGPSIPQEDLFKIFDPGREQREGMCSLELSACRSIVRRLSGSIEPSTPPDGGLAMTVTLPPAPGERGQ